MEIKIFNLKLKNFKGIKDLEVAFNGRNTNIYGANATGKTTVFDAFKWLFFDKDSNDRKDFNVKTLDTNNKPIHFLEHEVEATLIIDGQDMLFKKILQEKWVKRRGEEQQEFSGHETSYWIDEVPVKKKDYEEKINSIIPENVFKLITDPIFFNNQLSWKERRELLISISGTTITDEDILNSSTQYETLKENLQGRGIEDYKKVVYSKIKALNEEKEKLPVRIDELTKTLITEHEIDYKTLEENKQVAAKEIEEIEEVLLDTQKRSEENNKVVNNLAIKKNDLNNLKFKLENEQKQEISKQKIELANKKSEISNKILNNTNNIKDLEENIEKYKSEREQLRVEWDEENNRRFEDKEVAMSTVCPTCKQQLPGENIKEKMQELQDNFNSQKKAELDSINTQGKNAKTRQEEYEKWKAEHQEKQVILNSELAEIDKRIKEIEENSKVTENLNPLATSEYEKLSAEVEELEKQVTSMKSEVPNEELLTKKADLSKEIETINKTLNNKEVQEKTKARIEELEEQEKELSQKIQELESQQYQIEEFTKTKVQLLEAAINNNFEVVKFRLFDTQINGGLVECCDTLVNGVPYSDVNNAHKVIAGLDIIQTLSRFYNITAPIFIDNRESINNLCKTSAQIISLVVTEDSNLRIEVQ